MCLAQEHAAGGLPVHGSPAGRLRPCESSACPTIKSFACRDIIQADIIRSQCLSHSPSFLVSWPFHVPYDHLQDPIGGHLTVWSLTHCPLIHYIRLNIIVFNYPFRVLLRYQIPCISPLSSSPPSRPSALSRVLMVMHTRKHLVMAWQM